MHDDNDDAQHGNTRDMLHWFRAYIFDIAHPCYGQLTPVKTRYLLPSIVTKLIARQGTVIMDGLFVSGLTLTHMKS